MTIEIKEKQFEDSIEDTLLKSGYVKRNSENFDKKLILDSEIVIQFFKESQPQAWKKLQEIYDSAVEDEVLKKLADSLENQNMIHVLRNGFLIYDIHLDCAYFKPVSARNPDAQKQYQKNKLSIIRQAHYSDKHDKSVDLLLCLNGLPVATGEIKNPATGQTVDDAIKQYKEDRDPKEKLFEFKKRALVHFAIDPYEIYMTTKLNGDKTQFLPFNKGQNEGRGNPDNPSGYRTSYLWEKIWQKEMWLEIIENFIDLQVIDQEPPLPPKEELIFPRYHQLEAVLKLVDATKQNGLGTNYLVQHSTGSGKSNTIAWLVYKLFSLHDTTDKPMFDGIIVLSDRVGIVNQLANVIMQFEQTPGTVEAVESSSDLAENLETQRKILISTQQKFPFVLEKIAKVKGRYFAVIIDEAHSSQTGEGTSKAVKEVLTTNLEEAAKLEAEIEESQKDLVDRIEEEMEKRGPQETLSYYAFTATPKRKTLRLFGTQVSDENYVPFHIYSMKQAIEEGFILDVLKNYTTYERYFRIVKTAAEDKVVEGKKASRALMKYVDTHHLNLSSKAKVIVEHFRAHCQPKIGGLGKAMVVASSRLQAFKYKQEIDEYIKSQNYQGIKTLLAFSGSIKDEFGKDHTEHSINNTKTEWELREKFDQPDYNILIVAEKYQTGYDQPLLHTMYVDKKLHGIKAVQTLSRLNRTHPGKTNTFVVDFENKVEEIVDGFEPYYKGTTLVDKTDPVYLLRLYDEIMNFRIIIIEDLDKFAEIFFKSRSQQIPTDHGRLYATMDPVLARFNDADGVDQDLLKLKLIKYIEAYSFLTQVIPYDDTKLEKLFVVAKFLANENLLRGMGIQVPELKGDVSLQWYRLEKTHEGDISFGKQEKPLVIGDDFGTTKTPEVLTTLSQIIRIFNEKFGGDARITDADIITIDEWMKGLENDEGLRHTAQVNEFPEFLSVYERRFQEIMLNSLYQSQTLVSKIFSDVDLKKKIIVTAATYYHKWAKANNLPPITPANPSENRLRFRQTIRDCKGHLYWIDRYFGLDGLEFLMQGLDQENVKEVKVLTSLYKNENQINERLLDEFNRFKQEMKQKGISVELRVISTRDLYHKVSHDRYIIGKNITYNVPSADTVKRGQYSEIKKTTAQVPFLEWWNDKDSIDIVKEWNKIKEIRDKPKIMYDYICADCRDKFQLSYKLPSDRPAYCQKCFAKRRR